jgi:hypothetical protein
MNLRNIEKDKRPSQEIINLFEKVRVAYLSAKTDPKEYGSRWRNAVEMVQEMVDDLDAAGKELKDYVDTKSLDDKEINNPESSTAKTLFENIKLLRYSSELVEDPFSKRFKYDVLDELLENPETMVKFLHYALRADSDTLPDEVYDIKDMKPDTVTQGLEGLDLEADDIALYIIEHYGDGKDSKEVEKKVEAGMQMLELLMLSRGFPPL